MSVEVRSDLQRLGTVKRASDTPVECLPVHKLVLSNSCVSLDYLVLCFQRLFFQLETVIMLERQETYSV